MNRAAVVAEARCWVGTPFHHAARLKGVGVDCAQFLIAVYSAVGLVEPFEIGYYPRDWFLHQGVSLFSQWIERHCVPTIAPAAGDIALFRYGRTESHAAIVIEWSDDVGAVIHSYRGRGVIVEECRPGAPLWARVGTCWTFPAYHGA